MLAPLGELCSHYLLQANISAAPVGLMFRLFVTVILRSSAAAQVAFLPPIIPSSTEKNMQSSDILEVKSRNDGVIINLCRMALSVLFGELSRSLEARAFFPESLTLRPKLKSHSEHLLSDSTDQHLRRSRPPLGLPV